MHTDINLVFKYLILGAQLNKQVEIFYTHMYPHDRRRKGLETSRFGSIQPIKWEKGKHKNTLLILGYDVEAKSYRRFSVANIERVALTDKDWVANIQHEIGKIPV